MMLPSQTAASQLGEVPRTENRERKAEVNEDYLKLPRRFSEPEAYHLSKINKTDI